MQIFLVFFPFDEEEKHIYISNEYSEYTECSTQFCFILFIQHIWKLNIARAKYGDQWEAASGSSPVFGRTSQALHLSHRQIHSQLQ